MIRRYFACAAVSLSLSWGAPAFAQGPALSPNHIQYAREVVDLTGVSQNIDSIFAEFTDNTKQLVGSTRPELIKDMNEVLTILKPESDKRSEEMIKTVAEVFARTMSEADLKEISAFFKSPVGQRYTALRLQALEAAFAMLKPWSLQTANFLFDRFSQEMRKRGHQL